MQSTRRAFFGTAALFGASLVVSRSLVACAFPSASGRNGEPLGRSQDGLDACQPATISANHSHALLVPPEDVAEAIDKTYSIKGTSGHDHKVRITAQQFEDLAEGATVVVVSTSAGSGANAHTHTVTVSCLASPPDAGTSTDASGPTCDGARASEISSNHRHSLVIPAADIAAAVASSVDKTYSIKGTSSHDHQVTLTAANFIALSAGNRIVVASTSAGSGMQAHTHTVVVTCGSADTDASTP